MTILKIKGKIFRMVREKSKSKYAAFGAAKTNNIIKFLFTLFPILLFGYSCIIPEKSHDDLVKSDLKSQRDSLCFEATIDNLGSGVIPDNFEYGVSYNDTSFKNLSDSCEIYIGHDSHYYIKLSDVKYDMNNLGFELPNLLFLHFHSPTQSWVDSSDIGKRFNFAIFYKKNGSNYSFFHFAKRPKSRINAREDRVP